MEIVDQNATQIVEGEGQIIATSLNNFAMPFIRYSTGDEAILSQNICGCGRQTEMLKKIYGRTIDILKTPEGKWIHGAFFIHIFWKYGSHILQYQVQQKKIDEIEIKLVVEENFNENQLDGIKDRILSKSNNWIVSFQIVDSINPTGGGKYKYIINNI